AALVAPIFAHAEAGDWVVRIRAVSVNPNVDSDLGKITNKNVGGIVSTNAELSVSEKVIPELDISYYFTKNIAAELILATGTRHNVRINDDQLATVGDQDLGSVNLLPPTLTAQWHFNPDQMIDPYVGAGINYTLFMDKKLSANTAAGPHKIKVDSDSWGWALQAGVDINLKDGWLVNFDAKYVTIDTDVKLKGAATGGVWRKIDDLDINPWVIGFGVGKKF
ncbi:MAG: OmpW/AlkL family protein, partial [Methylotenera sp.]